MRLARIPIPQSPMAMTSLLGLTCIVNTAKLCVECRSKLSISSDTNSSISYTSTLISLLTSNSQTDEGYIITDVRSVFNINYVIKRS